MNTTTARVDWPTIKRAFEENDVVSGHLNSDNKLRVWNALWNTKEELIQWVWNDDVKKEQLYAIKAQIDQRDSLDASEVQGRAEQENLIFSKISDVSEWTSLKIWEIVTEIGQLSDSDIESVIFWMHNEGVENILLSDSIIYWVDIIGDNDPVLYPMYLKFTKMYPELCSHQNNTPETTRDTLIALYTHTIMTHAHMLVAFSEGNGSLMSTDDVTHELTYLSNEDLQVIWAGLLNH